MPRATGRARSAAWSGSTCRSVSMQHQYLVTEAIPAIAAHGRPLPIVRDPDVSWYLRQERAGLLLGPYEWDCRLAWEGGEAPASFGMELFEDDLDRLEPYIEDAIARVPVFAEAGLTRVINGPIPYTPDGNPLLGPAFGLDNFHLACAFSFGIVQAGGAGKAVAEWIAQGAPEWDLWGLDARRYTGYATRAYVRAKALRALPARVCDRLPVRGAARRAAGPDHAALSDARAPRARSSARAAAGSGRSGSRPRAGRGAGADLRARQLARCGGGGMPCRARAGRRARPRRLHQARGRGPGCRGLPRPADLRPAASRRAGRARLHVPARTAACSASSRSPGSPRTASICAAPPAAEWHDQQWLAGAAPAGRGGHGSRTSRARYGTLVLAGPAAREVLGRITDADLSNAAFPWLAARPLEIGCARVLALRINYVGELGWELHVPLEHAAAGLRGGDRRPAPTSASAISACTRWTACGSRRATRRGRST